MQIINKPLKDLLLKHVKNAQTSVRLCSPFVKKQSVLDILACIKDNVDIRLITNINLQSFYRNASDISALEEIRKYNGVIYNFQKLHAKIYIFDDKFSIITSANLTPSGLGRNFEYGVLISEKKFVEQMSADFNDICKNESTAIINDSHITTIATLLSNFPKLDAVRLPKIDFYKDELCDATVDKSFLENNLHFSGWQRALFNVLNLVEKQSFSKKEYIAIIPMLQKKYPRNKNIEAKIRQVLQQLRDMGLIKFEGHGVYTKLWK